ncbi:MAG TPA: STAS/SEC14 domain-containing protein [Myxococcales bacterium]
MKSNFIEHRGQKIFVQHFDGFRSNAAAVFGEAAAIKKSVRAWPEGQKFPLLVDIHDTEMSAEAIQMSKDTAAATGPHMTRVAIVGKPTPTLRMVFNSIALCINRAQPQRFFAYEELEKAKDWLVETT